MWKHKKKSNDSLNRQNRGLNWPLSTDKNLGATAINGPRLSLDNLIVNADRDPVDRRSLTREEVFVLAWFISNTEGRNYRDMTRDCKLNFSQCLRAVRGLIQLDLLRWR